MLFTDPCFLFLLLPIFLTAYYCAPRAGKNYVLLAASVFFYALGEGWSTFVVLASIAINFFIGQWIERSPNREAGKVALLVGVIANLGLLCSFKCAGFIVENPNVVVPAMGIHPIPRPEIHLPLGISFFTFHALSYITDVWGQDVKPMKRASTFALYIMLFPQLIAGPIIRYKTIRDQFTLGGNGWVFFTTAQCVNRTLVLALVAGVLGSVPLAPLLAGAIDRAAAAAEGAKARLVDLTAGLGEFALVAAIFIASTALCAAETYNPFIYFRF